MIEIYRNSKILYLSTGLSLLFFLRKGFQYAIIGSYIPLVLVLFLVLLVSISLRSNKKKLFFRLKIWSILIITWSIIRLLISTMRYTTDVFDEYHQTSQFGLSGIALSAIMLIMGVLIFRTSSIGKKELV